MRVATSILATSLLVCTASYSSAAVASPSCTQQPQKGCMPEASAVATFNDVHSAADCCNKCQTNPECKAWTLNKPRCYLHPATSLLVPGNCVSSGGTPPSPPPAPPSPAPPGVKNVLMIIVDDLRPEAALFNQSFMITPNIDRLGKQGMVFSQAYCQQAICGPTRNSFLSGRRPQRTKSWNFIDSFREVGPEWISFPQYFKEHGYTTLGTGKTYHPGIPANYDEPYSWSQDEPYYMAPNGYPACKEWPGSLECPSDDAWDTYGDWLDMNRTRTQIAKYSKDGPAKPFFLAYGAHRPHLPWNIPRHFWELYDTAAIPLPLHESAPVGMPPIAFTYELDGMTKMISLGQTAPIPYPNASTALPHNMTRSLRHGYYAAVSWTDYLIGQLLDALDDAKVASNTVVALIGDHGWQLGEHNIWGKHTNFELATRVPLIISVPGMVPGVSSSLVESVDLYPTIAAVAGLPAPADLDGTDLSPVLRDPTTKVSAAAYSEYPRCPPDVSKPWTDITSCVHTKRTDFAVMGCSVRTVAWRYTVWLHWDSINLKGDFAKPPVGIELYPHTGDIGNSMDAFENINLANNATYAAVQAAMHALAVAHWDVTEPKNASTDRVVSDVTRADSDPDSDSDSYKLQFEVWDQ